MILTPGEIYFLGEKDLKSGEDSPFVKIGLVRENESRGTADRLKDHQTGNPRLLHIVKIIKTPLVERVETILHGMYATSRVSGEWFNFTGVTVENAIAEANSLAKSAKNNIQTFIDAEEFKKKKSTSKTIQSTPEITRWYNDYLRCNFQLKQCDDLIKLIQRTLLEALKNDLDVKNLLDVQKRKPISKFDEAGFKKKYPRLWNEFVIINKEMKHRFTWTKSKDLKLDLQKLNSGLHDLIAETASLTKSGIVRESTAQKLQHNYLRALTIQAPLGWKTEIAEANVKVACGSAAGIENVCAWPRTIEERSKIDKDALRVKHLKKYEEFSSQSSGSEAAVLAKDRGFRA